MNKFKLPLLCAAGMMSASLTHAQIVFIDLGDSSAATTFADGVFWNTLTDPSAAGGIADLVWDDSTSSGISVSITDAFEGEASWGVSGTSGADLGALAIDSATQDGFTVRVEDGFGAFSNPGELTFSGLTVGQEYELTIFGNSHDHQALSGPTDFEVSGLIDHTGTLNTRFNTTEVLKFSGLLPAADGSLSLLAYVPAEAKNSETGQSYSLVNALSLAVVDSISVVPEPASFGALLAWGVGIFSMIRRRRRS